MAVEKRKYGRLKLRVPIELRREGDSFPIRAETMDLSLGGFYIEMLFTLDVGTKVDIALQLGDTTLLAVCEVATCDRSVGNGIRFTRMLPEDREELDHFLRRIEEKQAEGPQTDQGSTTE
jgi:hypothetical protein